MHDMQAQKEREGFHARHANPVCSMNRTSWSSWHQQESWQTLCYPQPSGNRNQSNLALDTSHSLCRSFHNNIISMDLTGPIAMDSFGWDEHVDTFTQVNPTWTVHERGLTSWEGPSVASGFGTFFPSQCSASMRVVAFPGNAMAIDVCWVWISC